MPVGSLASGVICLVMLSGCPRLLPIALAAVIAFNAVILYAWRFRPPEERLVYFLPAHIALSLVSIMVLGGCGHFTAGLISASLVFLQAIALYAGANRPLHVPYLVGAVVLLVLGILGVAVMGLAMAGGMPGEELTRGAVALFAYWSACLAAGFWSRERHALPLHSVITGMLLWAACDFVVWAVIAAVSGA